ncbi:hypothetical protein AURDEDRAFT_159228 [Auricularia subglabra TFB-10046 SS5]|nr:hypothetical protein AURDEDRAFT_159228 [Auricularia subglabra TFB-10046 SS5]
MTSTSPAIESFFLYSDVLHRFVRVIHPASKQLFAYVRQLAPDSPDDPPHSVLSVHPLWDELAGGIVLYQGLRRDGRTRTFLKESQVEQLRRAAREAVSLDLPVAQIVPPSPPSPLPGAAVPSTTPTVAQISLDRDHAHDSAHCTDPSADRAASLPAVSSDQERSDAMSEPPAPPAPHSLDDPDVDPLAFEDKVVRYTVGGIHKKDLVDQPVAVVYSTARALIPLQEANRSSSRTVAPGVLPFPAVYSHPGRQRRQVTSQWQNFSDCRASLEFARACYRSQRGTWIGVDLEASEVAPFPLTEIGVAFSPVPADGPACLHLAIPQPLPVGATAPVPIPFRYGTTRTVTLHEALEILTCVVSIARSTGPVFFVFHDDRMESRALLGSNAILPAPQGDDQPGVVPHDCVTYFDTQTLFAGLTGTHSTVDKRIAFPKLHAALGLPFSRAHWHNGGNDAKNVLDCLHALLTKDPAEPPLFLVPGAGARLPNELVGHIFITAVARRVVHPWTLTALNTSWRVFLFTKSAWPKHVVESHVKRMAELWGERLEPSPPGLARALRTYAIACLGRLVYQRDLDWLSGVLRVIENDLCWAEETRDAGVEGFRFFDLPYHPVCHAAYIAQVQEKVLTCALAVRGPRCHADLAIAKANLVFGDALRIVSRSSVRITSTVVALARVWWCRGRCHSARSWLFMFDLHPSSSLLDYGALLRNLAVCTPPGDHWHAFCYPAVMAMTAEHLIRGNPAQNAAITDALLVCLNLASQLHAHATTLGAATYRWQALLNILALARVLIYSAADTATKVRLMIPLLQAIPAPRGIARHAFKSFHDLIRRLACAAIVTRLDCDLGAAAVDQSDSRGGNKLALCLLACAHPCPCSNDSWYPPWATNYEAVLALAGAAMLAPQAVCSHVRVQLERAWQHAESACSGGEDDAESVAFCHDNVGMGYMSPVWALKTYKRLPASQHLGVREHSRYYGHIWSPRSPAWHALVDRAISRFVVHQQANQPAAPVTRRSFLLDTIARARTLTCPNMALDGGCFFDTCAPEDVGGGWSCCDVSTFNDVL